MQLRLLRRPELLEFHLDAVRLCNIPAPVAVDGGDDVEVCLFSRTSRLSSTGPSFGMAAFKIFLESERPR